MASGVAVDPKCIEAFQSLAKDRKYRGIFFKVNDDMTLIEVDKTFEPMADGDAAWTAFAKALPENDCRYCVYDLEYVMQGNTKNRVIFVLWSPEYSKVKSKMIYASSLEGVMNSLEGIQRQIQCTDEEEITYKAICDQVRATAASY